MKKTKSLFIILLIIMAFISVMSLIYGYINVQNSKAAAEEQNQKYIEAANSCAEKCKGYSALLDDSSDYDAAMNYYAQNIKEAENSALKVYIASAMAEYALNYISTVNINQEITEGKNSKYSKYTPAVEELNNLKTQLDNLE